MIGIDIIIVFGGIMVYVSIDLITSSGIISISFIGIITLST